MSRHTPVSRRPSSSSSCLLRPAAVALALASLPWVAHAAVDETFQLGTVVVTGKARLKMDSETAFTASSMRTTTGLSLSPRQTPQSVSVVTQAQMRGQGIRTFEGALNTTTGVNVTRSASRSVFMSRGSTSSSWPKMASTP